LGKPHYIIILCTIIPFFFNVGIAQNRSSVDADVSSTQATNSRARSNAKKHGPKEKKYRYIIRSDSKNTLKGNKCFEEVTRKFGFEYLIVPQPLPPNKNGFRRFIHNFGVKFILFFRNGPGWQLRIKKKYNECKYRYGDFVG